MKRKFFQTKNRIQSISICTLAVLCGCETFDEVRSTITGIASVILVSCIVFAIIYMFGYDQGRKDKTKK